METQKFIVSITFTDSVANRAELQEIAQNIIQGLKNQVNNGMGIAPEDSDACTFSIMVEHADVPSVMANVVFFGEDE